MWFVSNRSYIQGKLGLLTDQGLLAQLLGLLEVLLPLEQGKRLVDQRQHVHRHGLGLLLHLDGSVELLDSLLEVALVEQQLTIVVVHIRHLGKVLDAAAEGSHGRSNGSHLVLSHTQLDVRENKVLVQVNGLLVVLLRIGEVTLDEVSLGTVVVYVRVILVLLQSQGKLLVSLGGLTKLKAYASALDVALGQRGVQLDTLVKVLCGISVVAKERSHGSAKVVRKGLVLAEVAELKSLLESQTSLLISFGRSLLQALETTLKLTKTGLGRYLGRVLEAFGTRLGTEALEIVADEDGARQLGRAGSHHLLSLVFGKGLEKSLDGLGCGVALEVVDDARGGEVEQRLGVHLLVLVGGGAAVNGLDIVGVHGDGSGGVVNDGVPLAHGAVAGSAVGVEDGVGLAKDGLGVELNGLVVRLVAVGLVAGLLELGGIFFALLLGQALDNGFVDFGEVGLALDRGSLGLGGSGRFFGVGSFTLSLFALSALLLAELGSSVRLWFLDARTLLAKGLQLRSQPRRQRCAGQ